MTAQYMADRNIAKKEVLPVDGKLKADAVCKSQLENLSKMAKKGREEVEKKLALIMTRYWNERSLDMQCTTLILELGYLLKKVAKSFAKEIESVQQLMDVLAKYEWKMREALSKNMITSGFQALPDAVMERPVQKPEEAAAAAPKATVSALPELKFDNSGKLVQNAKVTSMSRDLTIGAYAELTQDVQGAEKGCVGVITDIDSKGCHVRMEDIDATLHIPPTSLKLSSKPKAKKRKIVDTEPAVHFNLDGYP